MEIELGQALGNSETWDFSPGFELKLIVKFNQKFNEVWVFNHCRCLDICPNRNESFFCKLSKLSVARILVGEKSWHSKLEKKVREGMTAVMGTG